MSKDTDQYGRKTWDLDAYAKNATKKKSKDVVDKTEYHVKGDKSSSHMAHREKLLKTSINAINKHTLINPNEGKNKRFGFTCPVCLLTYRDNMALIDHFNSPQHIQKVTNVGEGEGDEAEEQDVLEAGIRHASPEEVQATLKVLLEKHLDSTEHKKTMAQRIEARKMMEQRLAEKKRVKRQRKKQKKGQDEGDEYLASVMGFSTFGSTKK